MEDCFMCTKDYDFEKSPCPEGYLEDLSKYLTENQYTIDENGETDFTELLFSEPLHKIHNISCCVYFHYFINNDIDKLDKKFKEHLDSERQKNNLIVDDDDNEIKYMMNCIKKQQKYFYDSKTTLNETKKGIFMILCLPNGEMPVLIDDVGAKLTFKREDNENISFKTTNYIM